MLKDKHAWKVLEIDLVLNEYKKYARTELASNYIDALTPATCMSELIVRQNLFREFCKFYDSETNIPWDYKVGLIAYLLENAKQTAILTGLEIVKVRRVILLADKIKEFLKSRKKLYPLLWDLLKKIPDFTDLLKELSVVDEHGKLYDWASPLLSELRAKEIALRDRAKAILNDFITNYKNSFMLQERLFYFRNGRFVVPVKKQYVNRFPGMLQEWSGSGATAYMEPYSVVPVNNELTAVVREIEEEQRRILSFLTMLLLDYQDDILLAQDLLSQIDFFFACFEYMRKAQAILPELTDKSMFKLRSARHPLLGERAVPIDIYCGDEFKILVITGPNTGGKTVALKTVGVCVILAWLGMPIPAGAGSVIGDFDCVFADIGDEQSIQQNLSTFSSHIKNIIEMTKHATNKSLLLLDELGAGTDPQEGSAIALALLEYFREKGCVVVATTHHYRLKVYALATAGVESASVEFDIESLSPTYRLLMGVPGRSNAILIAKKLGLPQKIVDAAESEFNVTDRKVDDLIGRLHSKYVYVKNVSEKLQKEQQDVEVLKRKLQAKLNEIESKKEKILESAYKKASKVLLDAQKEAKSFIRALEGAAKSYAQREYNARLRRVKKLSQDIDKKEQILRQSQEEFVPSVGDYVKVKGSNIVGIVRDIKKDVAKVESEGIVIEVKLKDLQKAQKEDVASEHKESVIIKVQKPRAVSSSLMIRGMTADEAIPVVLDYLDKAYRAGYSSVSVIHGRGEGILRRHVHKLLSELPYVKEYYIAPPNEGGEGVTIVKFK